MYIYIYIYIYIFTQTSLVPLKHDWIIYFLLLALLCSTCAHYLGSKHHFHQFTSDLFVLQNADMMVLSIDTLSLDWIFKLGQDLLNNFVDLFKHDQIYRDRNYIQKSAVASVQSKLIGLTSACKCTMYNFQKQHYHSKKYLPLYSILENNKEPTSLLIDFALAEGCRRIGQNILVTSKKTQWVWLSKQLLESRSLV